jgi:hypothetical protein
MSAYKGEHEAPDPDNGAPIFDVTRNGIYPADVYGPMGYKYYGDNGNASDREAFSIVMSCRLHANKILTVYRAVPKALPIKKINNGDWVTTVKSYAREHGRDNLKNDYRILSKTVHARDLFTEGNSLLEGGFVPQPFDHASEAAIRERRNAKKEKLAMVTSGAKSRILYFKLLAISNHEVSALATDDSVDLDENLDEDDFSNNPDYVVRASSVAARIAYYIEASLKRLTRKAALEHSTDIIKKLRATGLDRDGIIGHPEYMAAKKAHVDTVNFFTEEREKFLAQVKPAMARGKAQKALEEERDFGHGRGETVGNAIDRMVEDGMKVALVSTGKPALVNEQGLGMNEKQLTSTGMQYAIYLAKAYRS